MNSMRKTIVVACLLICGLLIGQPTKANTIVYEGHLTNPSGQPLNGDFDITFRLYSGPSTTDVLWQEQHSIRVADGYFSSPLGSVEPLSAGLFSDDVYLGIEVGNTGELKPRTRLGAAPVAFFPMELSDRVRIIPASGTPEENGTRLLNAIAELQPSQGDRGATIILDSGIYDLGEDFLDVTNTTLVGQGRKSTTIKGSGVRVLISGTPLDGTDDPSEYPSTIMNLRVQHFRVEAFPRGVGIAVVFGYQIGEIHLENIEIEMASDAPDQRCFGLDYRTAGVINNISVDVSCQGAAFGLSIARSADETVHVSNVDIRVDSKGQTRGATMQASSESVMRNISIHSTSANAHEGLWVPRGFGTISNVAVKIDTGGDSAWYQAVYIVGDATNISNVHVNVSTGGSWSAPAYIKNNALYNFAVNLNVNSGLVRGVTVGINGNCDLISNAPEGTNVLHTGLEFFGGDADQLLVMRDASISLDLDGDCNVYGVSVHTTNRVDLYAVDADVNCETSLECTGLRTVSMEQNPVSSGIVNHSSFRVENLGIGPAEAVRLNNFSMDAFSNQFISNKHSIASFSGAPEISSTLRNSQVIGNIDASNPLSIFLSELELDPPSSNLSNTTCKGVLINGFFSANSC